MDEDVDLDSFYQLRSAGDGVGRAEATLLPACCPPIEGTKARVVSLVKQDVVQACSQGIEGARHRGSTARGTRGRGQVSKTRLASTEFKGP